MTLPSKPILVAVVPVAALLGVLIGRYTKHAPAAVKDERHETVDTKSSERLVSALAELDQMRKDLATWQAKASTLNTSSTVVTKWLPAVAAANGCPAIPAHVEQVATNESHAEEHSQGGSKATTDESKRTDSKSQRDSAAEAHEAVVTLHTEKSLPDWSVSFMPGVQFAGEKAVTLYGPTVVGASVEHRFIGPVFLGAWASTSGAAGISIRSEW